MKVVVMKLLFDFSKIALCVAVLTGCSTNRKTRYALMAAGTVAGAVVMSLAAPDDAASKESYIALGGLGGAGVGALAGETFYSDNEELVRLRRENMNLKNPPNFVKISGNKGKLMYKDKSEVDGKFEYRWFEFSKPRWLEVGNKKYQYDAYIEKVELKKKDEKK